MRAFQVSSPRPAPRPGEEVDANLRVMTPGYLRAIGVATVSGRELSEQDGPEARPTAMVNQVMAREYWASENPIGRRFRPGSQAAEGPWITVVGVVGDIRQMGLDIPAPSDEETRALEVGSPWVPSAPASTEGCACPARWSAAGRGIETAVYNLNAHLRDKFGIDAPKGNLRGMGSCDNRYVRNRSDSLRFLITGPRAIAAKILCLPETMTLLRNSDNNEMAVKAVLFDFDFALADPSAWLIPAWTEALDAIGEQQPDVSIMKGVVGRR
jgi:hypothetical protein